MAADGLYDLSSLMRHQLYGVQCAKRFQKLCLFYDTGTGKTLMTLFLLRERVHSWGEGAEAEDPGPALVVCPNRVKLTWLQEAAKVNKGLEVIVIDGSPAKRTKMYKEAAKHDPYKIWVINYEKLRNDIAQAGAINWGAVIFDESSVLRSMDRGNKTVKCARALVFGEENDQRRIPRVHLLSGCPNPNGYQDFYSQVNLVSPGLLSTTRTEFKARYFYQIPGTFQTIVRPGGEEDILSKVKTVAIFKEKKDCLDLPPFTIEPHHVELSTKEMKAYKLFMRQMIAQWEESEEGVELTPEHGQHRVIARTRLSQMLKARQMLAGIVKTAEDEWIEVGRSKMRAVLELCNEIRGQVIIMCQFKEEIKRYEKAFLDQGRTTGCFFSERSNKQKDEYTEQFQSNKLDVIIAHERSMSYGLNLQHHCSNIIWASLTHSYDAFKQASDRIDRYGQTKKTTAHLMVAQGTIDNMIMNSNMKKRDVSIDALRRIGDFL